MKPRRDIVSLSEIRNIGPATIRYLNLVGINCPFDLIGQDPISLYIELCSITDKKFDPCLADVFISAVKYMDGEPARDWWYYTDLRKALLEKRAKSGH